MHKNDVIIICSTWEQLGRHLSKFFGIGSQVKFLALACEFILQFFPQVMLLSVVTIVAYILGIIHKYKVEVVFFVPREDISHNIPFILERAPWLIREIAPSLQLKGLGSRSLV